MCTVFVVSIHRDIEYYVFNFCNWSRNIQNDGCVYIIKVFKIFLENNFCSNWKKYLISQPLVNNWSLFRFAFDSTSFSLNKIKRYNDNLLQILTFVLYVIALLYRVRLWFTVSFNWSQLNQEKCQKHHNINMNIFFYKSDVLYSWVNIPYAFR